MAARPLSLGLLLLEFVSAAPQASQVPPLSPLQLSAMSVYRSSTASASPSALPSLTSEERRELFELHEDLANIPSISNDEAECADYNTEYLEELGHHVEKVPVGSTSTYNVFAYPIAFHEEGVWPEVLITSHIDTAPPFYPFGREENGTVSHFGRGTINAKGPVTTMIVASHEFFESRLDTPRLGMLFVVGEEVDGTGIKAFASYAKNTTFRAAIFGEPTDGKLASGHKGSLGLTLEVKGKSARSAYP